MMIRFLSENKTDNPGCLAEHGLSVFVEACGRKILFDTGASDIFSFNAKKMGVDLSTVDMAVISHGHYDHTQGVPEFCRLNEKAPIYIHREAFSESYGTENGEPEKEPCSIIWTKEQRDLVSRRLFLTDGPLRISEDIVISGTIPYAEDDPTEIFYIKNEDGSFTPDDMRHEQFLAVRENGRIHIFSGCSHKGVIPAVRYARDLFPGEKIGVIMAGMHLYASGKKKREQVIKQLIAEEADEIMPVHCTGMQAICELKNALGDRCTIAAAGDSYGY